ncbi:MAG: rane fusion protein adhesin transport system, partial [Pseudomonadota bacterium]|nr:rane fusion protein adhesin transport system [Pseudomonadota bacterium]
MGWLRFMSNRREVASSSAGVFLPGDERFLQGRRQAELVEPMPRALWALYLLCGLVVVSGVWASQARVDIVAKAPGKVAPGGHEQVIASLEGGLLEEMLVREGDLVEAGTDLVRLDPTRF